MQTDFPAAAPFLPFKVATGRSTAPGVLGHIPLFSELTEEEQQTLLDGMPVRTHEPNQVIFWYGDKGDSFYLVKSGRVAICVPNDAGDQVVLNEVGPGGFFGEISLLDGGARMATARAIETTEVYVLSRDAFRGFLQQRPDAAMEILAVIGLRLRQVTEALRGVENPNLAFAHSRTTRWQRFTDFIAGLAANQAFMIFHVTWFGAWITLNLLAGTGVIPRRLAFDPFPFGLLTMMVSLEAILLSIMVMVSQNRQSEKDRVRTDLDYQVNVKAQTEIVSITQRLERIEGTLNDLARQRQF